jgi:hypothetical protein
MKSPNILAMCLGLAFALASTTNSRGDHHEMKPYVGSAAFEKMKSLAGTWTGTTLMEGQEVPSTIEYRVTSGGSAIVETIFAGTPKEMITVYHDDDNGELSLTHYCMLKNRPELTLLEMDGDTMKFNLSKACSLHGSNDPHMHSFVLTFDGDDKIVQRWAMWKDGAETMETTVTLNREKS